MLSKDEHRSFTRAQFKGDRWNKLQTRKTDLQHMTKYPVIYIYIYDTFLKSFNQTISPNNSPLAYSGGGWQWAAVWKLRHRHKQPLYASRLQPPHQDISVKKTVEIRQFYCNNNPVEDYGCVYGLSVSIIHFLIDTMIQNTINVIIKKKKKKKKVIYSPS